MMPGGNCEFPPAREGRFRCDVVLRRKGGSSHRIFSGHRDDACGGGDESPPGVRRPARPGADHRVCHTDIRIDSAHFRMNFA